MTLSVEVPKDTFAPKLVYWLLLKFEIFWTSTQWVTLDIYTPLFFRALLLHKFFYHPREVFYRNDQHETCSKSTHLATVKIS